MLAANYPFLDVMWTMLVFFLWVIWFWLLITVFADIFRRHDIHGGAKVLWSIFVIILPFLGVFIYMIAESKGMAERNMKQVQAAQTQIGRVHPLGRLAGRPGFADREREAAARQRRDQPAGVRRAEAEGARLACLSGARGITVTGGWPSG